MAMYAIIMVGSKESLMQFPEGPTPSKKVEQALNLEKQAYIE